MCWAQIQADRLSDTLSYSHFEVIDNTYYIFADNGYSTTRTIDDEEGEPMTRIRAQEIFYDRDTILEP